MSTLPDSRIQAASAAEVLPMKGLIEIALPAARPLRSDLPQQEGYANAGLVLSNRSGTFVTGALIAGIPSLCARDYFTVLHAHYAVHQRANAGVVSDDDERLAILMVQLQEQVEYLPRSV